MTPFFDPCVAQWVAARIPGCERGFGPCKAMGVLHGGEMVAGVVFHNWCPEHGVIELSAAATSKRWVTRPVIKAVMGYAFDEAECQMIVSQMDMSNDAPRALWRGLGATEYVIPRLRGKDADGVLATFTDDAWRSSRFNR